MTTVNQFSLSIDGLMLGYSANKSSSILQYDPKATCNLLQEFGAIEGFDFDKNGEPVILFSVNEQGVNSSGFCFWCDFVKSYPFTKRQAELIIEQIESTKAHRKLLDKIDSLLLPAHSPEIVHA